MEQTRIGTVNNDAINKKNEMGRQFENTCHCLAQSWLMSAFAQSMNWSSNYDEHGHAGAFRWTAAKEVTMM
eukprot:scaffold240974_cov35-Prasinocladus_malaysianus.AAC.1